MSIRCGLRRLSRRSSNGVGGVGSFFGVGGGVGGVGGGVGGVGGVGGGVGGVGVAQPELGWNSQLNMPQGHFEQAHNLV